VPAPLYWITDTPQVSRRTFLHATTSLAAAAIWSTRAAGAVLQRPVFSDYPFQLGVASGDPAPDGFVLWTRLAPRPLEGGGMPDENVEVRWQVANDEGMTEVVREGTMAAVPQWAHAVHVEVEGLQPDRWYFYRFQAGGEVSPVGRTRTAPAADASPERLNFAFASCQHFESGLYTAYEHMLREDLDVVVHLGDYIYEGAGRSDALRTHVGGKLTSLLDYRNRHAQYKTDTALQAMHAGAPWLVAWDDHEIENNWAGDHSERGSADRGEFLQQRARAFQAYYEHMPLRRSALPDGPDMLLYRKVRFGRLAKFFVLDTRQYRTPQPCGDGNKPPCDETYSPDATLLGGVQRDWVFNGLQQSGTTWNVLAQQVMMARVDRSDDETHRYSMDQWPGYEAERRRVLQFLHAAGIRNTVVLTGDIHSNWANELNLDPEDFSSPVVAAEFVGTSISSGGDGKRDEYPELYRKQPFIKFHNRERGYVRCEVTPNQWRSDYRAVEYVTRPGAPLMTRASFVLEDGRSGLHRA
jgi:alkaline phosphatase D